MKWRTITPSIQGIKGLQQEYQDSLNCPHCYALCSYTQYKLETTFTPIKKTGENKVLQQLNDSDDSVAIVKVYYAEETGFLYKTSVIMTWYDLLSTFGGLLGLILGASMIMVVEIFYFYVVRMTTHLKANYSTKEEDAIVGVIKREMNRAT